ncbi:hypothetical protein GCM10022234_27580 [Aeromicrobium panaciterrae]|uniref:hypothetical protein n=1 Tax=Aeromicrobium panaciterrae TaxID=363861 RepID=UPI0031DFCBC8
MNFSLGGVKRVLLASLATLTLSVSLAACTDDKPDPKVSASPTTAKSEADEASAAYQRYWDVYVQLANSGDVSPAAFSSVADGTFVERDLKKLGDQADEGLLRVGKPKFSDFQTTVDGDTATSLVCRDDSPWGAKTADGKDLPPLPAGDPFPYQAKLEKRDGAWIVVDVAEKADATCP